MIVILLTVIFILSIVIAYLCVDFYRGKKLFQKKVEVLEEIIQEISKKQKVQSNQLKLSDDLNENLKKSKNTLSQDIFKLNYELFDILSKNGLLKKR